MLPWIIGTSLGALALYAVFNDHTTAALNRWGYQHDERRH